MYNYLFKPILFLLDPEKAHHLIFGLLSLGFKIPGVKSLFKSLYGLEHTGLERKLFGLTFKNPVGLAAGFDKDGKINSDWACFGFGFAEMGTVTPLPQVGNPKKRMFRLPKDQALINRMGFNNLGVKQLVKRLSNRKTSTFILGGNIGKNKITPNDQAVSDYLTSFDQLFPYVDYFVINVSSPNTPNLRDLQDKKPLMELCSEVMKRNLSQAQPKPVLLKIAPDLTYSQIDDVIEIVTQCKLEGIIATNTTIQRTNLSTDNTVVKSIGAGGVSGKPLHQRACEVIQYISTQTQGSVPIIGVGGIMTPQDAVNMMKAGASLIQVYSGLVFAGPSLIKEILQALKEADIMNHPTQIQRA